MFQSPEALDQGELTGGVGAAAFSVPGDATDDGETGVWPEAGLRFGLGGDVDAAAKFAGFPPFGALYGDVRWQFLDAPYPVTAGLGASHADFGDDDGDRQFSFTALHPSLAVGTERFWVAGRGINIATGDGGDLFVSETLWGWWRAPPSAIA